VLFLQVGEVDAAGLWHAGFMCMGAGYGLSTRASASACSTAQQPGPGVCLSVACFQRSVSAAVSCLAGGCL